MLTVCVASESLTNDTDTIFAASVEVTSKLVAHCMVEGADVTVGLAPLNKYGGEKSSALR